MVILVVREMTYRCNSVPGIFLAIRFPIFLLRSSHKILHKSRSNALSKLLFRFKQQHATRKEDYDPHTKKSNRGSVIFFTNISIKIIKKAINKLKVSVLIFQTSFSVYLGQSQFLFGLSTRYAFALDTRAFFWGRFSHSEKLEESKHTSKLRGRAKNDTALC